MLLIDSLPIFLHILFSDLCNCDQIATVPNFSIYSYFERKVRFRDQKNQRNFLKRGPLKVPRIQYSRCVDIRVLGNGTVY
jgi:hypothetical protein